LSARLAENTPIQLFISPWRDCGQNRVQSKDFCDFASLRLCVKDFTMTADQARKRHIELADEIRRVAKPIKIGHFALGINLL